MESIQCYCYDFTLKYEESLNGDYRIIRNHLKQICKKGVFQLEKGLDADYIHWQGRFSLMKKKRLHALIKFFKNIESMNKIHLSVSTSSVAQNDDFNYVSKEETRIQGPYDITKEEPVETRQLKMFKTWELYPWQKKLKLLSNEFDLRKIDIIYNPIGNEGKSLFSEHMEFEGLAEEVPPYRLMDDIFQWVCCREIKKCYIFDMPRGMKKDKLGDLYSVIEVIKNGVAYDKYAATTELGRKSTAGFALLDSIIIECEKLGVDLLFAEKSIGSVYTKPVSSPSNIENCQK